MSHLIDETGWKFALEKVCPFFYRVLSQFYWMVPEVVPLIRNAMVIGLI